MAEKLPVPGVIPGTLSPSTLSNVVPSLIAAAGDQASLRFLEFFGGTIRNPHTRRAYGRAVGTFLAWCENAGVMSIAAVQPLHVAAWIELQTRSVPRPASSSSSRPSAICSTGW